MPRATRVTIAALLGILTLASCSAPPATPAPPLPTASTTSATPSVTPGTPTASASPSATPASASATPQPATGWRLSVPELGFSQALPTASVAGMGGVIDPPRYAPGRPSVPVWISDKGVKPAAGASDTTYLACHTSSRNGVDKYPCNTLVRTVKAGQHLVIAAGGQQLRYTVTQTRSIPYDQLASDGQTWGEEPNRVVFIMCDILDGVPTHANFVIFATLS